MWFVCARERERGDEERRGVRKHASNNHSHQLGDGTIQETPPLRHNCYSNYPDARETSERAREETRQQRDKRSVEREDESERQGKGSANNELTVFLILLASSQFRFRCFALFAVLRLA